jgi:hypothetical protein
VSAATGHVSEPQADGRSVRHWITEVRQRAHGTEPAEDDSEIAAVCGAAVDPLEIAAALEAAGMSRRVVTEDLGHRDVFSLADELWSVVPFREIAAEPRPAWRRGSVSDLGRGALYAAPALLIHAVSTSLGLNLDWWALPLAMTWGWATGQLIAFGGYRMRARNDVRGEARFVSLALALAVVTTTGLAVVCRQQLGGVGASVLAATVVSTYMATSAVLLLHEEEILAALLLAPAAAVGATSLLWPGTVPGILVLVTVLGSAGATLMAATRHLGLPWLAPSQVTRRDAGGRCSTSPTV